MSDRLISFTQWLDHCRIHRLPLDTPPPPEYQNYREWYVNSRGVSRYTGERALKDFGLWQTEQRKIGVSPNWPPPADVESYQEWFRRVRGLDLATGQKLTPLNDPRIVGEEAAAAALRAAAPTSTPGIRSATPSSYARQALLAASAIAGRLGHVGQGVRTGVPLLGAISTVIQAVRHGVDAERSDVTRRLGRTDAPHA